ncbi:MAG: hypothetical protein IPK66_10345 [Rhodospirillales bacterium]|nr:hypothetical protein [Rhodospirillales bacterium]
MEQSSPTAAETEVCEARRRVEDAGNAYRPALAAALLNLSRDYEALDRTSDALAAARESVTVLADGFLAQPAPLADAMRASVAQYVALAQRTRSKPDAALLAPIAQALGDEIVAADTSDDIP